MTAQVERTTDCIMCNGEGIECVKIFDSEEFADLIVEEVIFGREPFLELLECEIIEERREETEEYLIKHFLNKKEEYNQSEDVMQAYYGKIVDDMLLETENKKDLTHIMERLRIMPESASKVLLFRKLLIIENENK
jgi:hypothetical protein